MKKIVCIFTMLVLCLALACPALAAETEFVPSIDAKHHPEIVGDVMLLNEDGEVVATLDAGCIVLVAVADIDSTDLLTDAEKALFEDMYAKLADGSMTIPYADGNSNKVVRDLFLVKLVCDDGHAEEVAKENVLLQLTLSNGVDKDQKIVAMVYNTEGSDVESDTASDSRWSAAQSITNNGDGSVTVVLNNTGIVALAVPGGTPIMGDNSASNVVIWSIVMVASVVALSVLVLSRRKVKEQ